MKRERSRRRKWSQAAGFTLMEVLVALMILAMGLAAITFSNSVAITQVARVTRMTRAAFLMEGVVNDIHAYYVKEGFPTNNLENRECELPRDFTRNFECRYDLKGMELEPDMVLSLMEGGVEAFLSGGEDGGMSAAASELATKQGVPEGVDMSQIAVLAPLFGPDGDQLLQMCNINLGAVLMGMGALVQYMPIIIEQISRRTRQLTVRLQWKEGFRNQRELVVQTFVVSLPEEEMQAMREAERAKEVQEAVQDGAVPTTAPTGSGAREERSNRDTGSGR